MTMAKIGRLAEITGGRWIKGGDIEVAGICDDSRVVSSGDLFVAIKGELSDGHKYLLQAAKSGATAVCVQDVPEDGILESLPCPCLLVEDTLRAFQQIAAAHRAAFSCLTVVGITGSCGKTSSKEMCAAVLEQVAPGAVLKTEGNTNNHFGVPRNLLRIDDAVRYAVIEMGSNHPGEIANLASLARPDVSLICNIGHAHLEFFKDLRGVATEKGDILAGTAENGTVAIPGEAEGIHILRAKAGNRTIVTFGCGEDNDVRGEYLGYQPAEKAFNIRITWKSLGESREFLWSIGGAHQAVNAAGAAAIGQIFGLSPDTIVRGLQNCSLPGSRLNIQEIDGVFWANDAYNANPDSTLAALGWFSEVSATAKARILILGEMRELGDEISALEHRKMLAAAREAMPDARIITVGKWYENAAREFSAEHFETIDGVLAMKEKIALPGNWILLKGSNGVGVYKLVK